MGKKKKEKQIKFKKRFPLGLVGTLSTINAVITLIISITLFALILYHSSDFITNLFKMNQLLLVVIIVIVLIIIVFYVLFQLLISGAILLPIWINVAFNFIIGGLCSSASRNKNNIYSSKSVRRKVIISMILSILGIGIYGLAYYLFVHKPDMLTQISTALIKCYEVLILASASLMAVCFVINLIDYIVNIRKCKKDENGKIIDETIVNLNGEIIKPKDLNKEEMANPYLNSESMQVQNKKENPHKDNKE